MRFIIFPIFLLVVILLSGCFFPSKTNQVCFKEQCVDIEVVQKGEDRVRGLQFRDSLGEKAGMLFIFPESYPHGFWMKDTLIPLDIIWLDFSRRVVHVEKNVPPCETDPCPSYTSPEVALYVLEVNAGHAQKMGIQKGDMLTFHLKD